MNDTLTYQQFKEAFINLDIPYEQPYTFTTDNAFIPSMILAGTFAINSMIMTNYHQMGMSKTACVHLTTFNFIIGGLLSVSSYFLFR